MKRTWKKWLIGGVAAIAILAILVAVALHTPPARRFVLNQVRSYLLESQGLSLDTESLRYNLIRPSVTLRNVKLRPAAASDLPPLIEFQRLHVNLSWLGLFRGVPAIEEARIEGLAVRIVTAEQGRSNLPPSDDAPKEPRSSQLPAFLISSLTVPGASILYEDRPGRIRLEVPSLDLTVTGNELALSHEIQLTTTRPGTISFEQRTMPLNRLHTGATLRRDGLVLKTLELDASAARLGVSGTLQDFAKLAMDFQAKADVELRPLTEFAGLEEQVGGDLSAVASIEGTAGQLQVSANLDGRDLAARGFQGLNVTAATRWDGGANRVHLDSLNLRSPDGAIRAEGAVALTSAAGESSLRARISQLDLGGITRTLDAPVQVASRLTGDLNARWTGLEFDRVDGGASLRFAPTRETAGKDVLPLAGSVSAKSSGTRMNLAIERLESLGLVLTGDIALASRRNLSGRLQGNVQQLGRLVSQVNAFLGKDPAEAQLTGTAALAATLGGTIDRPTAAVQLRASELASGDIQNAEIELAANYNPDRVVLQQAQARWAGQTLSAQGEVGLGGRSPSLNLQARVVDLQIQPVLTAVGSEVPVKGVVNLQADVAGTVESPRGAIGLRVSSLEAYSEPLGELTSAVNLAGDRIVLEKLTLERDGAGSLLAQGSYNLETKTYSIQAEGNELQFRSLALPDGTPVRGTLNLKAAGEGSAEHPALEASLGLQNLTVQDKPYGDLQLKAKVRDNIVDAEIEAPRYQTAVQARLERVAPYPAKIELQAKGADLSTLPVEGLEGSVTASLSAAGELKHWQKGSATLRVEELRVLQNQQEIRTDGPLIAGYDGQILSVERAAITAGDSRLEIGGSLPLEPAPSDHSLTVNATIDLASALRFAPDPPALSASGLLTLDASVSGALKKPVPEFRLRMQDATVESPGLKAPVTGIQLQAEVREGSAVLQSLAAQWAGSTLSASGEAPLTLFSKDLPFEFPRREGPGRLTAEVSGLKLEAIPDIPKALSGSVSLRLEAQAPSLELSALTAKATFPELRIGADEFQINQTEPVTLTVRQGALHIDSFNLEGPNTRLSARGTAGLEDPMPLDVQLTGEFDAGLVALAAEGIQATGDTRLELAVTGSARTPEMSGFVTLDQAAFGIRSPRVQAEQLNARINLKGNRIEIERLQGSLNGGTLQAKGGLRIAEGEPRDVNLVFGTESMFLNFPEGLKTATSADINIRSQDEFLVVAGKVRLLEGSYRDPIELQGRLLDLLSTDEAVGLAGERSELLSRIRYQVDITADGPVIVDNNLAKLAANINVDLVGTYYNPALTGRVVLEEGGELYLAENKYLIERGAITFVSERRIEPVLDLLARTKAAGLEITLQVSGSTDDIDTTLTSDPPYPEPDIISALLTGRIREDLAGQEVDVARNQALSFLAGGVGGRFARGAEEKLGLSEVRIEPNLISAESNPGARLTVGQDITSNLSLVYSMNLRDSGDQIWIAEYDVTRRFNTRGIKQDDNSYRFEFRHDLRFGGTPQMGRPAPSSSRKRRQISEVQFAGNMIFPKKKLSDLLDLKAGEKYDFFEARQGADRLENYYDKQGRLEKRVRLNREVTENSVAVNVQIDAGPEVEFVYEGRDVPGDVRKQVRTVWKEGIFDAQRIEDSILEIRRWLVKDGYLESSAEASVSTPAEGRKRVLFEIHPGVKYKDVKLAFEGAEGITPERLEERLEEAKLTTAVHTEPDKATDFLAGFYRQQGYLDVSVEAPRYELDAQTRGGRTVIPIQEGPLFRVGKLEFNGNQAFPVTELGGAIPLAEGEPYRPELRDQSIAKLEEKYWERGYNDVLIETEVQRSGGSGQVQVAFRITENQQGFVKDIAVEGNEETSDNLVRSQLTVKEGEILDFGKLNRSRRNLYDTGAYSLVDIETEVLSPDTMGDNRKPVRLIVKPREVKPFELRYGAYFDTDRGPGFIADFANRNSLGSARVVGLRTRYDSDLRELRAYFSQPLLQRFPVRSDLVGFLRRELRQSFITDRTGFQIQQESRLRDNYILNYGYRLEQTHTFEKNPDPLFPFDVRLRLAPLTTSLTRESRDELLDATRGSFVSHALEFAPELLGSQLRFIRYFGQYFKYIPLGEPMEIPFTGVRRPRLVYAGGVRVGLARGLGDQELIRSERFFAGGGTTIRGFKQDGVGPTDFLGDPEGGDALFITNQEIRFPIFHMFDGVGFLDIGNVYPKLGDFDPFDVRKTGGVGLRVRTPYFLLRLDYGVKLDRKPGESFGALFFSIGQAF